MAKISYRLILGLFLLFSISVFADEEFEYSCEKCHSSKIPHLENFYFRYLQRYGSTKRSYTAMRAYLLKPTVETSMLLPQVIKNFGLHPPLSATLIDKMLPIYFEKYDAKKRLKFKAP
ncbi:hypothetical protein [Sulfuricurvum sp.]|uniref:hypothetical protein n=1 Tax=Sulfuricurvum sp. TaxID=2025608 RepID=UPI00260F9208|nr:hypothetical protein [Sulfuricurvum sp.]MDD3597361.1 hypothetical protein [Sulfuricurvum sp.]